MLVSIHMPAVDRIEEESEVNALDTDMTLSVRELVEFVLKAGDIDSRFQPRSSMLTGTRLHQKLQRRYEEPDEKEVHLKGRKVVDGISYQIEGRCDGIIHREGKIMVEEIKSTARSLDDLEEGMGVHWAQAQCYACLLTEERGWDAIHVRLTYIHTGTEETKSFTREYDREELQGIMIGLLQLYTPFAEVRLRNEENLEASLSRLSFPFETFRKGQRQLVGAVYKTVTERKTLFANAPTGTGKTISTLFPVVKEGGRWFYATAKTISRTVAEDAVKLMEEGGLSTRALTITAKDKICFKDQTICQPDHCEFACGHYDRVNGAILDILQKETLMTRPVIEEYAKAHRVCPFEFSIDLSYLVEGVIGDYNYLFDPRTSLKRFSDSSKKQTTLLIDEAHNLVPRGRDMHSASLTSTVFTSLATHVKGELSTAIRTLTEALEGVGPGTYEEVDSGVTDGVRAFVEAAEKELPHMEGESPLLEAYFESTQFLRILQFYSKEHRTLVTQHGAGITFKLVCLDPAAFLRQVTAGYKAAVFFSATLHPFSYYFHQLGGEAEDYRFVIPTPFDHSQWQVEIQPLSIRFRDRDRHFPHLMESIVNLFNRVDGNGLVFFPSYAFMRKAFDALEGYDLSAKLIMQEPMMSEKEREEFLAEFQAGRKEPVLGLAVLGGIFSEGIDLKGERLNQVVVVGVGLPQPDEERELMKSYFNSLGVNGFAYAYTYPGLNKVFQSGGRLIRTEVDRGVLRLIDDRYLSGEYQKLLLEEWRHFTVVGSSWT